MDLVRRPRMHDVMDQGGRGPLTLVSAPAGYGKSTLVSCWLESRQEPSAWLSLDDADSDLRVFLSYVVAAVRTAFPDACAETQALLKALTLPPVSTLASCLANDLDAIGTPFVLVLDDYHRLNEPVVHELLSQLLKHPPRPLHLVISTRYDPPLPLSAMRAQGHVTEVRLRDLEFTRPEADAFLKKAVALSVSDRALANLQDVVEGWMVGLYLISLVLRHQDDPDSFLCGLRGSTQHVQDYLVTEVLATQPPVIQDQLMKTSVLDRFCAPLCDAVCTSGDGPGTADVRGEAFIELLEKNGLFSIALDSRNEWYRYHHLFQELLQERLRHQASPKDIVALHSRASRWFASQGLIREALQHALAGGDVTGAAEIIERNRHAILNADKWYVLRDWLARLPNDIKQQRPGLLLAQAWISYHRFRVMEIPLVVERLESILDKEATPPDWEGELNLFKAYLYYWQGQPDRTLACIQKTQENLLEGCDLVRADAEIYFGLAHQMSGHKQVAIEAMHDRIRSSLDPSEMVLARRFAAVSFVHLLSGELRQSTQAAKQLADVAGGIGLEYANTWSSYLQGCCCFQRGVLDEAREHLSCIAKNRYIAHTTAAVSALVALAMTHEGMGQTGKADETMNLLLEFAQETADPSNVAVANSCQARLSLLRGNLEPAVGWMRTFDGNPDAPSMIFFLEIPYITRCRVLIAEASAASLNEAVERLEGLRDATEAIHNTFQLVDIVVLQALALHKQKRTDEAIEALKYAIHLGEPDGWVRPFVEPGPAMADLLHRLGRQGVAVTYASRLAAALAKEDGRAGPGMSEFRGGRGLSLTSQPPIEPLTNREEEILELLAQRLQGKEIAAKLFISSETVKSHLKHLYQKLHVSNRRQAVARARAMGILPGH